MAWLKNDFGMQVKSKEVVFIEGAFSTMDWEIIPYKYLAFLEFSLTVFLL